MMLAYRLVRLIETHSEQLALGLTAKLRASDKTRDYDKVPPEEFRQRVYGIYHNLGEWLLGKSEAEIERRYTEIGATRQAQAVPLSQLIYAITLTKEHLFDYMKHNAALDQPVEIFGELELLQLLDQFFDRAQYYAAVGYERARGARAAYAAAAGGMRVE